MSSLSLSIDDLELSVKFTAMGKTFNVLSTKKRIDAAICNPICDRATFSQVADESNFPSRPRSTDAKMFKCAA